MIAIKITIGIITIAIAISIVRRIGSIVKQVTGAGFTETMLAGALVLCVVCLVLLAGRVIAVMQYFT